ncbi:MAG: cardiolipin synthase [Paracoccaceae bacterium]
MSTFLFILLFLVQLITAIQVLLRPHRDPYSRLAWIAVIFVLPVLGIIAYLLLGVTSIGRGRAAEKLLAIEELPDILGVPDYDEHTINLDMPEHLGSLFKVGFSSTGMSPVGGNSAILMKDTDSAIDNMVEDIDAAENHVHLMFYIWLPDNNGGKVADALIRATQRGVTCRAMVDDLGSKTLVRSDIWEKMDAAGVKLARALQIGNPLKRIFDGRIDLRNHRKILIVDNKVTYCGSQNCADPAFLPKAKFAPWVDAVMRFEGPIVRQNQFLFAIDWMANYGETLQECLVEPLVETTKGFPAQVVASGPTGRHAFMPEMFVSIMYSARSELVVTTPYYVPDAPIQAALCAAANRGVKTTIIIPAQNDDFAVGATAKSYYLDLLEAGVDIYEFEGGLLHTKSMTVDGQVTLIGSANLDRRSFDLNYENNILLYDVETTKSMRERQDDYISQSREITLDEVINWTWQQRLWNNTMAIVGPVL